MKNLLLTAATVLALTGHAQAWSVWQQQKLDVAGIVYMRVCGLSMYSKTNVAKIMANVINGNHGPYNRIVAIEMDKLFKFAVAGENNMSDKESSLLCDTLRPNFFSLEKELNLEEAEIVFNKNKQWVHDPKNSFGENEDPFKNYVKTAPPPNRTVTRPSEVHLLPD
jgi:hypothetical protein